MNSVAEVFLWGTRIGIVAYEDGSDAARFEYDGDFASSGIEVSPLVMPLGGQVFSFPGLNRSSFHGLPGLLADSLPDKFGNAVIDRWLEAQGREAGSMNPVERLCYTGSRGMGALEFVPATGPDASASERIEVSALVELASRILSQRERFNANDADEDAMQHIIQVGTSAGGARAKAVIAWNEKTGEIRSGQVNSGEGFGHWLIKFDDVSNNGDKEGPDRPSYTLVEYAYHLMAASCGIDMSECQVLEDHGRHHFMTKRFDRVPTSGGKLHMQTLAALAHFDFMNPLAHSYEQAVSVMRRLGLGQDEIEQLFTRMVFNVMARNHDDHVKNISFLMDRFGRWSLSPAYDVTYAYNPLGAWTSTHQMSLNGKRDGFDRADLLAAAGNMSIPNRRAKPIIDSVGEAVGNWKVFAEAAHVPERTAESIARAHLVL